VIPYSASIDEVLGEFSSDPKRGLTTAEVSERLSRFGKNELPAAKPVPAWRHFLAQFTDPLVLLLLVATAISAGLWLFERETSLPYEALAILSVVLLNAVMGYVQESRAEQAVAALRQMSAAQAHVIRDGERRTARTRCRPCGPRRNGAATTAGWGTCDHRPDVEWHSSHRRNYGSGRATRVRRELAGRADRGRRYSPLRANDDDDYARVCVPVHRIRVALGRAQRVSRFVYQPLVVGGDRLLVRSAIGGHLPAATAGRVQHSLAQLYGLAALHCIREYGAMRTRAQQAIREALRL
jgi:hypothetical protein